MAALPIAQAISLIFAYALQKTFVFRTRGNLAAEFARFSSFYLGIYAVNWVALPLLVEVAGLRPSGAQVGFALVTVVGSYFFHTKLTFRAAPDGA